MSAHRRWPLHGWCGVMLVALFWWLNWSLEGARTHWGFFPLWLGYCLVVDALVLVRKGSSLLTRSPARYVGLFAASIPAWWLFELINLRTGNWLYIGRDQFSDLEYALLASLSFSTVMPAVFGSAELVGTLSWLQRMSARRWRLQPTGARLLGFALLGWAMLALLLIWPVVFFPCVWASVWFILEPVNARLGHRSLLTDLARGDVRPVLALWGGCLLCGFFWEMWNFHSYPKWIYDVPFVDFGRVFEMPILGYGGYLPFALELFALYALVTGPFTRKPDGYVQIVRDPS